MSTSRVVVLLLALVLSISFPDNGLMGVADGNFTDNIITQWNAATQQAVRRVGLPNQIAHRTYALVHLSQYKALQAAYGNGLSHPEAAAVYAAHYVLSELFPSLQSPILDGVIAEHIYPLNLTVEEDSAIQSAAYPFAVKLLRNRVFDGSQKWAKFRPAPLGSEAGKFQYLPNSTWVFYPQLGATTPFVIGQPQDFDIFGGPPRIPSPEYDSDYDTIVTVGNALSPLQTDYQKETAKFWEDGANTSSASGQLFNVTLAIVEPNLSVKETAKLFAKFAVGAYDAHIVTYYLKYKYLFWRPYTAVTQGDPGHMPNQNYATYIRTPPHPDYPSGHSTSGGAFAAAVTKFIGNSVTDKTPNGPFQVFTESYDLPPRTFDTVEGLIKDIDSSRVYGGVHFPRATEIGYLVGLNVTSYVWDRFEKVFGEL